jgi:hypothetical protein
VVDCGCRDDGPWTVYGPYGEVFLCVRCGEPMNVKEVE